MAKWGLKNICKVCVCMQNSDQKKKSRQNSHWNSFDELKMLLGSSQRWPSSGPLSPLLVFYLFLLENEIHLRSRKKLRVRWNAEPTSAPLRHLFLESLEKNDDVTASICACPETTGPCWFEVPAASLRLLAACLSGRCCFGRAEKGEIYTGEESVHMRQQPQTFRPSDPPRTIPFFFSTQLKILH